MDVRRVEGFHEGSSSAELSNPSGTVKQQWNTSNVNHLTMNMRIRSLAGIGECNKGLRVEEVRDLGRAHSMAFHGRLNASPSPEPEQLSVPFSSLLANGSYDSCCTSSLRASQVSAAQLQKLVSASVSGGQSTGVTEELFASSRGSLSASQQVVGESRRLRARSPAGHVHPASFPSSSNIHNAMGASSQRKGCAFCGALQALNGGPLSRCKQCNMAAYCGEEHQKFDWKRHKRLCKTVQSRGIEQSSPPIQFHLFAPNSPPRPSLSADSPVKVPSSQYPSTSSSSSPSLPCDSPNWISQQGSSAAATVPSASPDELSQRGGGVEVQSGSSPEQLLETTDPDIQIIETTGDMRPLRSTRKRPQPAVDFRSLKDHSKNAIFKTTLHEHLKMLAASGHAVNQHQAIALRLKAIAEHVIRSLNEYGWAVVDNFLGITHCRHTFQEMQQLYKRGLFSAGQLMDSKDGSHSQDIRSDEIYWFDNNDERAQDAVTIRLLVSMIDSVIVHFNGRIPYKISGRSRAMVAVYPGNGTRYVKHVDNPLKDGRCITTIYYSNEAWDVNQHGGTLRLYPECSLLPVDIDPQGDRLVFFWSDRRNPHEVMPAFRNRYALTIWYFDHYEKLAALERRRVADGKASSSEKESADISKREADTLKRKETCEVPEPPVTKPKVEVVDPEPRAFIHDPSSSFHRSVICSAQPIAKSVTEPRAILPEQRRFDSELGISVPRRSSTITSGMGNTDSTCFDLNRLSSSVDSAIDCKKFLLNSLPHVNIGYRNLILNRLAAYSSCNTTGIPSTSSGEVCSDCTSDDNDEVASQGVDFKPEYEI